MSRSRTWRSIASILSMVIFAAKPAFAEDYNGEITQRIGPGDPISGKEKSIICQGCHGEDGNSLASNIPKLAGQYSSYISKQIIAFQKGTRKDSSMTYMASTIRSQRDLDDVTAYFSSQKLMVGSSIHSMNNKFIYSIGESIFHDQSNFRCINCHGQNGIGIPHFNPLFPIIGGQNKSYLVKQLHDFKYGKRDTDMSGTMGSLTAAMTDFEIEAVSEYLSRCTIQTEHKDTTGSSKNNGTRRKLTQKNL